jgi:DNA-binding beta-propeller fold protein YncE
MDLCPRISFVPSEGVKTALANLGRTEDVQFSPDDRRLAIAGFNNSKILLLDIKVKTAKGKILIKCEDWLEITSPSFDYPHGLFWIDSSTLIIANRNADAPIIEIPSEKPDSRTIEIMPIETINRGRDLLRSPGSVSVSKIGQDLYDAVICNNYAHNVSRHLLDARDNLASKGSCRLLAKGFDVPDGISHSHSGEWIAVSNHHKNAVFMYRNDNSIDEESEPIGKLRGMSYPHGLRFSHDDRYIFVADAGAPLVHVYKMDHRRWSGKHFPAYGLRVMDNETFIRGHTNPQEGGPKGIDLTNDDRVLVVSCEEEPIVFFDVRKIFETLPADSNFDNKQPENTSEAEQTRSSLLGHINLLAKSNANARAQIDVLKKMVAAGLQERNTLVQKINNMKAKDS